MQYSLSPQPRYLAARLDGLVSPAAWEEVLRQLEAAIAPTNVDRLLLDLTAIVGWLGQPERQAVGGLMATRFAKMKKVALVIQAVKITGVVENEAQRRGLNLKIFSDMQEAERWVLT